MGVEINSDQETEQVREKIRWFSEWPMMGKESLKRFYNDSTHSPKTAYYEKPKNKKKRLAHFNRMRARRKAVTELVRAYLYDANKGQWETTRGGIE